MFGGVIQISEGKYNSIKWKCDATVSCVLIGSNFYSREFSAKWSEYMSGKLGIVFDG